MKYTKELLEQHVADVVSFTELARRLGIAPVGGNTTNLAHRCKNLQIDTSHFTGSGHNKGRAALNKFTPDQVLRLREKSQGRETVARLRTAMVQSGIPYTCGDCGAPPEWRGKPLTLQIDHRNGQYWDNRRENLCFVCPNCHSQTETWGNRT